MTDTPSTLPFGPHSEPSLLKLISQQSGMSMVVIDRNARIQRAIGEIAHEVDYDENEAVGISIDEFFKRDPDHAMLYHRALKGETFKVLFKSREGRDYEATILPIRDERSDEIFGAFGYGIDVTEREITARAQSQRELELENLFQSTTDAIVFLNRNFEVQRINTTVEAMYPDVEQILGSHCHCSIYGRSEPCEFCPVAEAYKTGKPCQKTIYDEKYKRHVLLSATPIFDPKTKELIGAFELVRDITEQIEHEETLKSQEALVTEIFSSIQEGMFLIDRDYNIVRANKAFEMMNQVHMPVLGKKCFVTAGFDKICEECPAKKTFETGESASISHKAKPDKEAPEIWVEHFAHPLFAKDGSVQASICVIRNITERKESEDALNRYRDHLEEMIEERTRELKESESQMRVLLDNSNSPIFIVDTDFRFTFVNDAFLNWTGYTRDQLIGQIDNMIFDPEYLRQSELPRKREQLLKGEISAYRSDVEIRTPDGRVVWGDMNKSVVHDSNGKITQIVAVVLDITANRQMMKELNEARIAAEQGTERVRTMLDAMPFCCSFWNKDGKIIDCNPESSRLFKIEDKQFYIDHFEDLSPEYQPDGRRTVDLVREYNEVAFEKGLLRFEWMHQTPAGEPIPVEVTLVRVRQGDEPMLLACTRDLREEKRMLAEMRAADERTRIMLDATPLCCNFWDENYNNIDCNEEAPKLFGLKSKQEYLERFFELSPEYQPDGTLSSVKAGKMITEAFENGKAVFEWLHQKLDGEPIPAEITLVRVKHGEKNIVLGYTRDLREENRMRAEMRDAEERTRIMLDATPLCCNLWDETFNNIDCNEEAVKLFELKNKQEYLERFFELSPPIQPCGRPTPEMALENITKAFREGRAVFEWMHQKLNGDLIPAEITLVRVKRGDHFIVAGYTRDLRELKKNEAALELDRKRTNDLLELSQMTNKPDGEIIDFTIKSASTLTKSTVGYVVLLEHASETLPFQAVILDQSLTCSLPTKTADGTTHTLSPALTKCLTTKQAVVHDDFKVFPGYRVFPAGHFEVHSHLNLPILDGDRPIGIMGVGNKSTPYTETDVKQLTLVAQGLSSQLSRKRYSENLEKAKNEAENANRAKSEFLAHMSHEIRTPLNGVIGLSDLLIGTKLNEKQYEYAQLINASGKSLLFLINDILDFSKIEAGKLEIDSEPFDLPSTVESVLGILSSRAGGKDLELGATFDYNVPRIVRGDSGRIRQILLNLVGNAVKFTEHGGVRIEVSVASIQERSVFVRFNVIDTGIGIPKDRIDRLFKAFSQADASSARTYGGTGLGLAISLKLVKLMQGDIGVESVQGEGSTFWFTANFDCEPNVIECLKREETLKTTGACPKCHHAVDDYCSAIAYRVFGLKDDIKGRRVLIVDDNKIQRETLQMQLNFWGLDGATCSSSKEADLLMGTARKENRPFDLLLIDNSLQDGSGFDWAKKLRSQIQTTGVTPPPMILLRNLGEEFDPEFMKESETESVPKPVFASALFDAIMNQLFEEPDRKKYDSGIIKNGDRNSVKLNSRSKENASSQEQRKKSPFEGRIHLLVVEDNRVNQIVAKNLLLEAGFTCDIANNGNEACVAVRKKQYDVVLMDCQMPEMDGYEATDLIRKWEMEQGKKRIPIIALTANATKEDVQKCLDSGMDAYCSKPINPQMVIKLVEEMYEKSTGHTEAG